MENKDIDSRLINLKCKMTVVKEYFTRQMEQFGNPLETGLYTISDELVNEIHDIREDYVEIENRLFAFEHPEEVTA